MLIKMLDDCRFDFFVMLVVVCLVVFCYEELSCIVILDVDLDWLKYMIWFVDFLIDLKFVVFDIYVFLCLFIKLVVVIDVLGKKVIILNVYYFFLK